jgi:hypothetical protein
MNEIENKLKFPLTILIKHLSKNCKHINRPMARGNASNQQVE